jgi:dihydrolipoamide dehydrogenase
MYADFGTEVTLLEALPRILPGVDAEVSVALARAFRRRNIAAHAGVRVTSIEGTRELSVTFEGQEGSQTVTVDQVVVCVGRAPRTQGIGLEDSGVQLDRGFVRVNGNMQTTVPGVYAVGDVVATPALAHVAFSEAIVAIKTIMGEDVAPIDYEKVPWGIYCHPEVAFAGLTEEQARERGFDVVTAVQRFVGDGRALILGEPDGILKLVQERGGPILGVHIVGPWATELLAEGYLAVNWEASAEDLAPLIHPHPTLSEVFGEATLALTGRPLH